MNTALCRTHITDDLGNDVVTPSRWDREYEVLCAVAEAADGDHRAHCHLLTADCPLCNALAALDAIRHEELSVAHN